MSDKTISRRQSIKILAAVGASAFSGVSLAGGNKKSIGAMIPGKGWVKATGVKCEHDGTPLQFMPKTAPDANPAQDDVNKYPRCPYCGMSRKKWAHSRHLVHYDDGLADGTCSIHCASISLSLNLDRGVKAIYAADFGASGNIKPLKNVDNMTYLIGSKLKGTMSANSKMAFSSKKIANTSMAKNGGTLGNFDAALTASYQGMAKDTMMIRKRRAERMKKMMKNMG